MLRISSSACDMLLCAFFIFSIVSFLFVESDFSEGSLLGAFCDVVEDAHRCMLDTPFNWDKECRGIIARRSGMVAVYGL
jgi:hypothetical protein